MRLVGITNPPLESAHNWRQTSGLMVARGFLEVDNNIFYPRKEDHKGTTGIIGFEFPVLNYTHYLISKAFGHTHWYSRLIVLLVSTLGLWFFYLMLKRLFNEPIAFTTTLITAVSIWFMYSRKTMPDVYSVSLVTMGVYAGLNFLDSKKWWQLALFFVLSTLGVLAKIPAVLFLGWMIIPVFSHGLFKKESLLLVLFGGIGLAAAYWWYFVWNEHLAYTYGIFYNRGFSFEEGWSALSSSPLRIFELLSHSTLQSYVFFACSLAGLVFSISKRNWKIILATLPIAIGFGIFALKAGEIFLHHSYYMVPFAPVMALFAGYFLSQLKYRKAVPVILALGIIEGIANQQHDFFIKDSEKYKLTLEPIMDEVVHQDSLVGIASMNENHLLMYLAHRKGWMIMNHEVLETEVLLDHKQRGCDYLILDKHIQQHKPLMEQVYEDENFAIFKF